MLTNDAVFVVIEGGRLVQDRFGDADLANVVQLGGQAKLPAQALTHALAMLETTLRLTLVQMCQSFDAERARADEELERRQHELTFMATQRAARLRPDHLQLTDVGSSDFLERAVPRQSGIPARSRPQIRILRAVGDLIAAMAASETQGLFDDSFYADPYPTYARLRRDAPVIADVAMVASGITGYPVICKIGDSLCARLARTANLTLSAAAVRLAHGEAGPGALWLVGCAPTALAEIISRQVEPALVIGVPVGFVGAAEVKDSLRASGLPALSNISEKGGSAVAVAAFNALLRIASKPQKESS